MYENDVWSGLADFLANMIEKYAGEMDLDALPDPRGRTAGSQTAKQAERHRRSVSKIYAAQCRSETGCVMIRPVLWDIPIGSALFFIEICMNKCYVNHINSVQTKIEFTYIFR